MKLREWLGHAFRVLTKHQYICAISPWTIPLNAYFVEYCETGSFSVLYENQGTLSPIRRLSANLDKCVESSRSLAKITVGLEENLVGVPCRMFIVIDSLMNIRVPLGFHFDCQLDVFVLEAW